MTLVRLRRRVQQYRKANAGKIVRHEHHDLRINPSSIRRNVQRQGPPSESPGCADNRRPPAQVGVVTTQRRRPNGSEPNSPSIHSLNISSRPSATPARAACGRFASSRMIVSKARKSDASLASNVFLQQSRSAAPASTLAGHGGLRDGRRSRSLAARAAMRCFGWDAEVEQVGGVLGGPVEHVAQNQAARCCGVRSWIASERRSR